ncbi:duf71 -containing protein [Anaeramoeba flamelloides]|uniref:Diphthine--ammonia ligase n=1 Tax=Anaeramoeba flamelloides TaxID=1746091 RepID=A0ABQ8YQP9_9EUKA|nr:duf71 -containing protein [Anaeramoeba flamelloides]
MKIAALISGGKDSFFTAHVCVNELGHELCALVNLYPSQEGTYELDSYSFQTVGHELIEAYAECTDLPLYRRPFQGLSPNQDLQYKPSDKKDEVEDLYAILKYVKEEIPDLEGICCGAILSNYQRTRVENVCSRLDLIVLAPLWRIGQPELLRRMVQAPMDSILIKVASMGLNPKKHLGKSLVELEDELMELSAKYQLNCCGEGGEYESLTLDCPIFEKRIVLDDFKIEITSDNEFAPVGYVIVKKFHLEQKSEFQNLTKSKKGYKNAGKIIIYDKPTELETGEIEIPQIDLNKLNYYGKNNESIQYKLFSQNDDYLYISGVWNQTEEKEQEEENFKENANGIIGGLNTILNQFEMNLGHIVLLEIALNSNSQIQPLEKILKQYFLVSPPSRVIWKNLNRKGKLKMSVTASKGKSKSLHVLSRSNFSPPCLGNYSHLTEVNQNIIISSSVTGRKALDLSFPESFEEEVEQAILNLKNYLMVSHSSLQDILYCRIATNGNLQEKTLEKMKLNSKAIIKIFNTPSLIEGRIEIFVIALKKELIQDSEKTVFEQNFDNLKLKSQIFSLDSQSPSFACIEIALPNKKTINEKKITEINTYLEKNIKLDKLLKINLYHQDKNASLLNLLKKSPISISEYNIDGLEGSIFLECYFF